MDSVCVTVVTAAMNLLMPYDAVTSEGQFLKKDCCYSQGGGSVAAGARSVYQHPGREGFFPAPPGRLDR